MYITVTPKIISRHCLQLSCWRVRPNILDYQLGPLILCILNCFRKGRLVCIHHDAIDFHNEIEEDFQTSFRRRAAIVHLENAKSTNLSGPQLIPKSENIPNDPDFSLQTFWLHMDVSKIVEMSAHIWKKSAYG